MLSLLVCGRAFGLYDCVLCRVAIDRGKLTLSYLLHFVHPPTHLPPYLRSQPTPGLRLADKRSFPCPHRTIWLEARDSLYEEIMQKAWNPELEIFGQAYEDKDVLDSSLMIMPLVFFSTPSDPRFLSTLKKVLLTPERGGLTSNVSVFWGCMGVVLMSEVCVGSGV